MSTSITSRDELVPGEVVVINAGSGTVTLTAATNVTDTNGAGTLNITGGVVTLKANNGGISTDVNAGTSVSADSSAANGAITLQSDSGNLPLGADFSCRMTKM